MGFYIRKSVRLGPLRLNLSKSGVGVSAGVKGLRFGTGPRGNYVHMGRGGIYYRQYLCNNKNTRTTGQRQIEPSQIITTDNVAMEEIESADTALIVDSSSQDLINEFIEKRKKMRLRPFVFWLSLPLLLWIWTLDKPTLFGIIIAIAIISLVLTTIRDRLVKTVVVLYDLDNEFAVLYEKLYESICALNKSKKIWHISAKGNVSDYKYNSGADTIVKRHITKINFSHPPFVKTNVSTPSISVGKQTLYFFPDKILIFEGNTVGAVSYGNLNIEVGEMKFIESEGVPSDARIVDRTWRYVNKKGGPDKRFNNNYEIPIALYQTAHFKSNTGLNELLHISKLGLIQNLKSSITHIGTAIRQNS
ncbi:MAG: DUF4236 domain-containing protein [Victivallales bacterium]|nr:DUF4236 domain-containing protein [Victivallales bacterium]